MPTITKSRLQGIAPNRTDFEGRALEAENVDLSGGGIKQIKAPSFVEAGHTGEICFHKQEWVSGDHNYISTDVDSIPALVFKTPEDQWKINVNNIGEYDLWIDKPSSFIIESDLAPVPNAPTLSDEGAGDIESGDYEYFFSHALIDNDTGDVIKESEKTAGVPITVTSGSVKILRGSTTGMNPLLKLLIYRRQVGESYVRLVDTISIQQAVEYDTKSNVDLGSPVAPEETIATKKDFRYVVVWVRYLAGWEHESIPSDPVAISQYGDGVKISLTEGFPAGVVGWRIYRLSLTNTESTTSFQLVADLDTSETEYEDTKENVELGEALGSNYRSDNGNLVTAGIPDEQFDGMAGPFNGFFVGWIGRDLYLSEPGNPAWWPGSYVTQANYDIKAVLQYGPNISIVTTGGVQFGYGTHPDSFVLSQSEHGAGGVSRTATARNFYLGYDGIYAITESGASLFTNDFDAEYFEAIDHENSWMVIENEKMILFHPEGGLVFDIRSSQWSTLSKERHTFNAVWETGGHVYGVRDNNIVKIFGDDPANIDYTGVDTFAEVDYKRIEAIRFSGSGQLTCSLYDEDNNFLISGYLDLDTGVRSDKTIYTPAWTEVESIRYKLSGKGEIRSIMFDLEAANTRK